MKRRKRRNKRKRNDKKKDKCLIARYRCNEPRDNQHWKDLEDKICRVYEGEEENLIHVLREC